jgi:hypothetical protein
MPTVHSRITAEVVASALSFASTKPTGIHDTVDTQNKRLIMRVRGKSVSFFRRVGTSFELLGKAPDMSAKQARDLVEAKVASPKIRHSATGWTWREFAQKRHEHLLRDRGTSSTTHYGSKAGADDARRSLLRPQITFLDKKLTKVTLDDLIAARDRISKEISPRQSDKFVSAVRGALKWAKGEHGADSGLSGVEVPYWLGLQNKVVYLEEVNIIRRTKNRLTPADVGRVLAAHERFCDMTQDRSDTKKVSFGVRLGFASALISTIRRGAASQIRCSDLNLAMGLAAYRPEVMKAKSEFVLPLHPVQRAIMEEALRERGASKTRSGSMWVFPSRQQARNGDLDDICVNGQSLTTHIYRMQGKRSKHGGDSIDYLEGLAFNLHAVRSAMFSAMQKHSDKHVQGASALLSHSIRRLEFVPDVSDRHYNHYHMLDEKLLALDVWVPAVLAGYEAAGGPKKPYLSFL